MLNLKNWLRPKNRHSGIVFFDGVCGICNRFVDYLLKRDKMEAMQFAPLQGETASKYLPSDKTTNISTIVYKEDDKIYVKSSAAIRCIAALGGGYKLILIFLLVPRFIRNFVYEKIAQNRYQWFGKKEACRIPTQEERNRILL